VSKEVYELIIDEESLERLEEILRKIEEEEKRTEKNKRKKKTIKPRSTSTQNSR